MAQLSSDLLEKRMLAYFFLPPYHVRMAIAPEDLFANGEHRILAGLLRAYVTKYKHQPTRDTILTFSEQYAKTLADVDRYSEALLLLQRLPEVKSEEFDFFYDRAINYTTGRKIFDAAESIKEAFENNAEIDFRAMRRDLINRLLVSGEDEDNIRRGFIYSNVRERWEELQKKVLGEDDPNLLKFGIDPLDKATGGMRRSFVTLLYSRTSGGKTRTAVCIAYNNAICGKNVVFFSMEMNFNLLATCFDSRMALVDSSKILIGSTSVDEINKYKAALKKQVMDKLGIWIVDIPKGAKSSHILDELEMYKATTGLIPELVIVDYANLMEPMGQYSNSSEKYNILFKEYHEIARVSQTGLLTLTQEKREATEADKGKKKKDVEDTEGVENIGLSSYIAPHCEIVIRLRWTRFDMLQNRMMGVIDKNRYGTSNIVVPLVALFEYSYVGDRKIAGCPRGVKLQRNIG